MTNSQDQLSQLEKKINDLIYQYEKIRAENSSLRNQLSQAQQEKDKLLTKNQSARKQIDLMIDRLKSM